MTEEEVEEVGNVTDLKVMSGIQLGSCLRLQHSGHVSRDSVGLSHHVALPTIGYIVEDAEETTDFSSAGTGFGTEILLRFLLDLTDGVESSHLLRLEVDRGKCCHDT